MPGGTMDKTVGAMDADSSTPFKVTVRIYDITEINLNFSHSLKLPIIANSQALHLADLARHIIYYILYLELCLAR